VKRTPLTIALVFLMLPIVSIPIVEWAVGNLSPQAPLPTTPDKNEPSITINEPIDNKTYDVNTIHYSLTIRKPSSWFDYDPVHGQIMVILYKLDNNDEAAISNYTDYLKHGKEPFSYQGDLNGLSDGNHSFQIRIHSDSYYNSFYDENDTRTWNIEMNYYIDTYSEKINFTVNTVSLTLEPSPTIEPTQSPLTPSNSNTNDRANFPATYILTIVVIVVVTIAIGTLLLFRRYRKTAIQA
jgi:hypothetical protein